MSDADDAPRGLIEVGLPAGPYRKQIQRNDRPTPVGAEIIDTVDGDRTRYRDEVPDDGIRRFYRCRNVLGDQRSDWTGWVSARPGVR